MVIPAHLLDAIVAAVDTFRGPEVEDLIVAMDRQWPGSAPEVRRELTLHGRDSAEVHVWTEDFLDEVA